MLDIPQGSIRFQFMVLAFADVSLPFLFLDPLSILDLALRIIKPDRSPNFNEFQNVHEPLPGHLLFILAQPLLLTGHVTTILIEDLSFFLGIGDQRVPIIFLHLG